MRRIGFLPLAALLVPAMSLLLAACGSSGAANGAGNGTDVAFIEAMESHDQTAIEMAKIAEKRSASDVIRSLAEDIADVQGGQLRVMDAIMHDMSEVNSTGLGLSATAMSAGTDPAALKTAVPFDRAFVDMMIASHRGAISMARVQLAKGKSQALKNLAEGVISVRSRQIEAMNAFRRQQEPRP